MFKKIGKIIIIISIVVFVCGIIGWFFFLDKVSAGQFNIEDMLESTGGSVVSPLGFSSELLTADNVYNLARLISCEAGGDKELWFVDELLVGSVFMNLWKVQGTPPGTGSTDVPWMECASYGARYGPMHNGMFERRTKPLLSTYYAAYLCLSGQFAIPNNVQGQNQYANWASSDANLEDWGHIPSGWGTTTYYQQDINVREAGGDGSTDWLGRPLVVTNFQEACKLGKSLQEQLGITKETHWKEVKLDDPLDLGIAPKGSPRVEDILEAADKVDLYMAQNGFYYGTTWPPGFNQVYNIGNSRQTCCSTYVCWVLQEAGFIPDSHHMDGPAAIPDYLLNDTTRLDKN